jgi:hypothetical protein
MSKPLHALMRVVLSQACLPSADSVLRLHEALCFMRAYPDDPSVQAQVASMLKHFDKRADLQVHREALADSGIAGTAIHYRFFHGQAQWLAQRWPAQLQLDRDDAEPEDRLARALVPTSRARLFLTRWMQPMRWSPVPPRRRERVRFLKLRRWSTAARHRPTADPSCVLGGQ